MKYKGRRTSSNVDDRRGRGGGGIAIAGGGIGLVIVLIITLLGGNPDELIDKIQPNGSKSDITYE